MTAHLQQMPTPLRPTGRVALAHDYVTQRGGAERVTAVMAEAFPGAPLYTTLYEPATTFAEFDQLDIRPSLANQIRLFRRYHRLAFPLLAPLVSSMQIDADVLLASSSGWAHGIRCTGRTVVYCHAPARWLYQRDRYLGPAAELSVGSQIRHRAAGAAAAVLDAPLRSWDRRRALAADRYLVNSTVVQQAVRQAYGIEAEVLPPPPAMLPTGELEPISEVRRPFLLCVARLLPYKNVAEVILATKRLQELDLLVVGRGPDRERLLDVADGDPRIHLLGSVSDAALRWCYAQCEALVAASYEDYGLSPLEAAAFGKPTVALEAGGYLDTLDEAVNGVFFDEPEPARIAVAINSALNRSWIAPAIAAHAERFGKSRFITRLQAVIAEELG